MARREASPDPPTTFDRGTGRSDGLSSVGDMTIDAIAHDAGIPASTVRMYQNKGLLPPPERRGRVGYYGEQHRDRLRLIAHLQDRGFSLAAIKEALEAWAAGRTLDHLLGVAEIAPGLHPEPLRLTPAEFAAQFEGIDISADHMRRAAELGLVELDGADVTVPNAAFVDIGPAVIRLGVPVDEVLDEYEALRVAVASVAERFRQLFDRHIWQPFENAGMPADRLPGLTDDVAQLTALASGVVTTELHQRFAEFVAEYVAKATGAVGQNDGERP